MLKIRINKINNFILTQRNKAIVVLSDGKNMSFFARTDTNMDIIFTYMLFFYKETEAPCLVAMGIDGAFQKAVRPDNAASK